MTVQGGERPHGSHLGSLVSAYVDRDLAAGVLHGCDQHLAVCGLCRSAAEDERRLLESMRRSMTPCPSSSLQSALLGLADHVAPVGGRRQLPVVDPGAPALHRSPMRAAVLAGLAASAAAAAAVSLGLAGIGSTGSGRTAPTARPAVSAATVQRPLAPAGPLTGVPALGVVPAAEVLSVAGAQRSDLPPFAGARARLAQSPHE